MCLKQEVISIQNYLNEIESLIKLQIELNLKLNDLHDLFYIIEDFILFYEDVTILVNMYKVSRIIYYMEMLILDVPTEDYKKVANHINKLIIFHKNLFLDVYGVLLGDN